MSTTAATQAHEETIHGAGHAHPTDRNYVVIALILGAITAVEVALFYLEKQLGSFMVPALLILMMAKFSIVAMWFMHLRFDSIMFRRFFVTGIVLATVVYLAAMTAMQVFGHDTTSTIVNPDGPPAAIQGR